MAGSAQRSRTTRTRGKDPSTGAGIASTTASVIAAQRLCDPGGQTPRDRVLAQTRPAFGAFGGDEGNGVFAAAHDPGSGADVIGDDPVAALLLTLPRGIGDDVVGLGGKADNQTRAILCAAGDAGKDVGV